MVFLFRSGSFREKLSLVLKATRQHARNLASFAVVYKTSMLILRIIHGKEGAYDTFFAGLLGGYTIFGSAKQGSVNQQIVIYVFARVVLALARLSLESPRMTSTTPTPTLWTQRLSPEVKAKIQDHAWPVFASLSWAMVMYVFRWQPESIQPSLRSSMKYMYVSVRVQTLCANVKQIREQRSLGRLEELFHTQHVTGYRTWNMMGLHALRALLGNHVKLDTRQRINRIGFEVRTR